MKKMSFNLKQHENDIFKPSDNPAFIEIENDLEIAPSSGGSVDERVSSNNSRSQQYMVKEN